MKMVKLNLNAAKTASTVTAHATQTSAHCSVRLNIGQHKAVSQPQPAVTASPLKLNVKSLGGQTSNKKAVKKTEAEPEVLDEIKGFVTSVFWEDEIKGRVGFTLKTKSRNYTCYGPNVMIPDEDQYIKCSGHFSERDEKTFNFRFYVTVDDDEEGAENMLKHIFGVKKARKILDLFGEEPTEVLKLFKTQFDYFKLVAKGAKGIGTKTIDNAKRKYENSMAFESIYAKFAQYGMSVNKAIKIYKVWGDKTMDVIAKDPYALISIDGLSFNVVDKIGMRAYGISSTDNRRIVAFVKQSVYSITSGSTFLYKDEMFDMANKQLHIDSSYVSEAITTLVQSGDIYDIETADGKRALYSPTMYRAEKNVAARIAALMSASRLTDAKKAKIDAFIKDFEKSHFKLAKKQHEAVTVALSNRFSVISGGPGTGKSTILGAVVDYYTKEHKKIMLCAPTGKAAKRMMETTGMPATTIHRMLEYNPAEGDFMYNTANPLDCNVLVVDEFSMVGVWLAQKLLEAIPDSIDAVVFVGDKNQLPSVDAGKVLEDILDVPEVPQVILNETFRQGKDSSIFTKAMEYQNDIVPSLEDDDEFKFHTVKKTEDLIEEVKELYKSEVDKWGIDNVTVLCPQRIGEIGSEEFNKALQQTINPKLYEATPEVKGTRGTVFREGDRVIQIKNEAAEDVYNGMVGTVVRVQEECKDAEEVAEVEVDFGDDVVSIYQKDRLENLQLAYATTVHKSQGSEYKSVILLCHEANKFMLQKKLIYTGMTRAKKVLHIVGEKKAFADSVKVKRELPRHTNLKAFIRKDLM